MSLDSLLNQLTGFATGGGVRVFLKTNLGAEIPLYEGSSDEPSLLSVLGIRAGIVVRDSNGRLITTYNDPPQTDPAKQALLWALLAALAFVVLRGVMP